MVWVGTKDGDFSVRSAYHMAINKITESKGSSSNPDVVNKLWKTVWNLRVPPVTKVFLWKACNNILPTKLDLYKKGITEDPLCPICN